MYQLPDYYRLPYEDSFGGNDNIAFWMYNSFFVTALVLCCMWFVSLVRRALSLHRQRLAINRGHSLAVAVDDDAQWPEWLDKRFVARQTNRRSAIPRVACEAVTLPLSPISVEGSLETHRCAVKLLCDDSNTNNSAPTSSSWLVLYGVSRVYWNRQKLDSSFGADPVQLLGNCVMCSEPNANFAPFNIEPEQKNIMT
jgi:hypothetical protein